MARGKRRPLGMPMQIAVVAAAGEAVVRFAGGRWHLRAFCTALRDAVARRSLCDRT
jgi:hypothetical protein